MRPAGPVHAYTDTAVTDSGKCNQRCSQAAAAWPADLPELARFCERSLDAVWLLDSAQGRLLACNTAARALAGAPDLDDSPPPPFAAFAPERQPDGQPSTERVAEAIARTLAEGSHRFEWQLRRRDGTTLPLEVVMTLADGAARPWLVLVGRDISGWRRAEAALGETERLLTSIANHLTEAIYRTGPRHELMFVNQAYLQLFGYSTFEELRGLPREQLYARPADRRRLIEALERDGVFANEEIEFRRKDGRPFWGLVNSVAIRRPATGAVDYHVGSILDITDRRQADDAIRQLNATLERRVAERTAELQATEERARILVEHAPETIVVFDGDTGRFVTTNENASRFFGLSREALVNLTPMDVSPLLQPDGRPTADLAREKIAEALAGGTPVFEWTHRHASGRLIPCEVRLVRLPGSGPRLLRASILDNTERHRREAVQQATYQISEAVHTARDLPSLYARIHEVIRGLMPASNFYIAQYDPASQVITFPYFVDEVSTRPGPRPVGTGLTGYVLRTGQPLLVDAAMNQRKRTVRGAVTFEGYEGISYVESGVPAAIWLGVPLCVEGVPLGVMAVQDYQDEQAYGETEKQILTFVAEQTALAIGRKRAQEQLHAALAREKELGRLKSNFVSMVSHEFRTPLAIIQSSAEILRDYFEALPPADRQAQLESIFKNTRRMADLMEEVLLLGQLDAGRLDFRPVPIDLRALGRRLVDEVQSATGRRCPLRHRAPRAPTEAVADERLLRHILTNLLSNAIKYSAPGSPVDFALTRRGPDAVWTITDRGIGIPEADQPWLFGAFHRGSNVGERQGSGLGLVIVRRCVELHGGRVEFESRLGQGTRFVVLLPVFGGTPPAASPDLSPLPNPARLTPDAPPISARTRTARRRPPSTSPDKPSPRSSS